jgi:Arc/MetJ-type ribon-helix-helix transcriptional regulator
MAKVKISVAVDPELLEWAQQQVKETKYASLSHAVNHALKQLKDSEQKGH